MATLHTVNKSPFERNTLDSCVKNMSAGDALLIIEDGVIGARKGSTSASLIEMAMRTGSVYVLGVDLAARGMNPEDLVSGAKVVDYGGFVDLVTQHDRTVAWL